MPRPAWLEDRETAFRERTDVFGAGVAQRLQHRFCKAAFVGSSPTAGSEEWRNVGPDPSVKESDETLTRSKGRSATRRHRGDLRL
jgi:hypothetical protein